MSHRVLIVGAGLTGSVCACTLRREMQHQVKVEVWDKARGPGGRMSTSRRESQSVDLGAQYITATPASASSHRSFYAELMHSGVLRPLEAQIEGLQQNDENKNYVSPQGMSAVVKHFLSQSGADVFFECHMTGLYSCGASWEVQRKNGDSKLFDTIVLTMPVPQILQLQGDMGKLLTIQQRENLGSVVYSSCFALALFFSPETILSFPWAARYVTHNDCIRYIAVDLCRGNADASTWGPSLVVHTSVQFGLEHLEWDKDKVKPIIMQELHKVLPGLPQPVSIKCHKWRYSR
ncbi:renalase-like [Thalassophryne amazonica]|uniref:renalase-like n=1 Tax=Thalassophryne amazonica TaxID=390379 RepID=UPI0014709A7C|nr:renalase-like [Thalassophryne amazonica]